MRTKFTFFDFCAGIGAGHLALKNQGGRCVGFSEIDPRAEATYRLFFGGKTKNFGDLMKIDIDAMPDFDFLIAGFPCQTFSIVGKRAGMRDSRGRIILGLARILRAKKVPLFLMENVKGLVNHNHGTTLRRIVQLLEDVGYSVSWRVLNSKNYGVPQNRERVYLVGYRRDLIDDHFEFPWPEPVESPSLMNFLVSREEEYLFSQRTNRFRTFRRYMQNKYNRRRFELSRLLTEPQLVIDTRQSDMRLYYDEIPTLRTGRHGILYTRENQLRDLSGEEALLLQGFPRELAAKAQQNIRNNALLSQAGNAMTVSTVQSVTSAMFRTQRSRRRAASRNQLSAV